MTVLHFGLTPKMKPVSPRRSAVVASLDIGTSKVVCLIARLEPQAPQEVLRRRSHGVRILGFAHTAASGMKAGSVVDLVEAEEMIRQAIDIAESMAGVQIESVVVSLSGGRLGSERFIADIELANGVVTDGEIARVLAAASRHSVRGGRAVLHSLPIGYALDAATGIRDPRGMLGHTFGVDMHMVTADVATVRNLMLAVERSHLSIEAMVASPYVAGLAVAGRRRGRSRRRLHRFGRRNHHDGGVFRRPLRPCRRLRPRRSTTSPWIWPAVSTPESRMLSESKRFMAVF